MFLNNNDNNNDDNKNKNSYSRVDFQGKKIIKIILKKKQQKRVPRFLTCTCERVLGLVFYC